jgi:1-acyl-sn-glycerol-3-phosphate acyltransferase
MGLSKFIFNKLLGWKIIGSIDPDEIKKAVIIVVPHTSWHDFYIGVFVRKLIDTEINFVAKKELFKWPFGWYFKWMGGAPLDRSKSQNKVDSIVELFNTRKVFRLAMAPEGTRKKVPQWRSGYYYIAKLAKVPIIPVSFDYSTKQVTVGEPFITTDDFESDTEQLKQFFEGVVGKVPEHT